MVGMSAPGRADRRPPASFGRPEPQDEIRLSDGGGIHVVVHAEVLPDEASLDALHKVLRETTRSAVLAGYADAFAEIEAAAADEDSPAGGNRSTPTGEVGG